MFEVPSGSFSISGLASPWVVQVPLRESVLHGPGCRNGAGTPQASTTTGQESSTTVLGVQHA